MKFLDKKDLTIIGQVNKAAGFKGELSCLVTIAHPESLLKQKFLFIKIDGLPVPFLIQNIELNGEELIVKFEDVDTEEHAKRLTRKKICCLKIRAKKKTDLLSWTDIKGYSVIDSTDGELGKIEEVIEYPMQMIARCIVQKKEIMFPLNDDLVTGIDDKKKILYVNLPEGLLSMYL